MKINFESELEHSLDHVPNGKVKEAALYSLTSGGKRIRPSLLFSTLEAYHINNEKGLNAAIGLEMIHTYSLIHDDLPAMDNDDLRRGVMTCHKKYGEDMAILAGDALLNESFYYASVASDNLNITNHIVREFAKNAGLNGMIYGQELDVLNSEHNLKLEDLLNIHTYKTGRLIRSAFTSACMIADRFQDLETWEQIGDRVGLLFQIQDDVLDVTSSDDVLGKPVHSDERNNKTTYVSLIGIETCKEYITTLHAEILELLNTLLIDVDPLRTFLESLVKRTY